MTGDLVKRLKDIDLAYVKFEYLEAFIIEAAALIEADAKRIEELEQHCLKLQTEWKQDLLKAIATEREECAKIAETEAKRLRSLRECEASLNSEADNLAFRCEAIRLEMIAAAIRARK